MLSRVCGMPVPTGGGEADGEKEGRRVGWPQMDVGD